MMKKNQYNTKLLDIEEKVKYYKKGAIYLIGNMADYGSSAILMTARDVILEKRGYYVYNPMKIIPYDSSEDLRNRILINRLMECNRIYVMTGYEKSSINQVMIDLAEILNYKIIYEE